MKINIQVTPVAVPMHNGRDRWLAGIYNGLAVKFLFLPDGEIKQYDTEEEAIAVARDWITVQNATEQAWQAGEIEED